MMKLRYIDRLKDDKIEINKNQFLHDDDRSPMGRMVDSLSGDGVGQELGLIK